MHNWLSRGRFLLCLPGGGPAHFGAITSLSVPVDLTIPVNLSFPVELVKLTASRSTGYVEHLSTGIGSVYLV